MNRNEHDRIRKEKRRRRSTAEQAVALRYREESDTAPRLVAKGRGELAQKIKRLAHEHDIPIHRDDDLVELLAEADLDREIPSELYGAVAEILAWIYRANDEMRQQRNGKVQ